MNKFVTASIGAIILCIISYMCGGKHKYLFAGLGAATGFGGGLWAHKVMVKQEKDLYNDLNKEYENEVKKAKEAGIHSNVTFEDSNLGNEEKNLYNAKEPLTKRLFGIILKSIETENNVWKEDDINGAVNLFRKTIYDEDGSIDDTIVTDLFNHEADVTDNMIHILNNVQEDHHFVEILIKIPAYIANGRYATPTSKNYRESIIRFCSKFWEKENIKSKQPNISLKGFYSTDSTVSQNFVHVILEGKNYNVPFEEFVEIHPDDDFVLEFATKKDGEYLSDGISRMSSHFSKYPEELDEDYGWSSCGQFVSIEIEVLDGTKQGLEIIKLLKFLSELKNISISRDNGDCSQNMGSIVFHPERKLDSIYTMNLEERYSLFLDKKIEIVNETN